MNANMLRSFMALYGDTNKTLAGYLGITPQTLSDKINERGTEFRHSEMTLIRDRYKLTPEQFDAIFFN